GHHADHGGGAIRNRGCCGSLKSDYSEPTSYSIGPQVTESPTALGLLPPFLAAAQLHVPTRRTSDDLCGHPDIGRRLHRDRSRRHTPNEAPTAASQDPESAFGVTTDLSNKTVQIPSSPGSIPPVRDASREP